MAWLIVTNAFNSRMKCAIRLTPINNALGKVVLKMTVQGLTEVARWVLYHAPNACVLEPKSLRDLVAENAARVAATHR